MTSSEPPATAGTSRAARLKPPSRPARWTDDAAVRSIEFTVARETSTLEHVFRLVHRQHVWREDLLLEPCGSRPSLRDALPSSRVLVAKAWPLVIGTITVFQDSPLGLPMDEIYKAELDALRLQGRRLGEVSALACDTDSRPEGLAILMRLARMALLYAAEVARLDDLCLAVNPRHVAFYEKAFGCRPIGGVKRYAGVNGAAVALRLELQPVRARIAQVHTETDAAGEAEEFLYGARTGRPVIAQLERETRAAGLTAEQFEHFFAGSDVLARAAPAEREYVESLHRNPAC